MELLSIVGSGLFRYEVLKELGGLTQLPPRVARRSDEELFAP
jgi:hypothetical protein